MSLGLVGVSLVVYTPLHAYGFISFDDPSYVSENSDVLGGLTLRGILWAFTTGHASNWHPLTWLSHMVDVQLYGANPGPQHLTNVAIHIANTLLLFGLLNSTTGTISRSAFVAALFAVHPLHVESVAWIAERKDVLSTFFWMLTLWAYVRYVRDPQPHGFVMVVVWFALGLMAKPMVVTLPFVLLLFDVWPLRRVHFGTSSRGEHDRVGYRRTVPRLLAEKLPLLALAIVSSVITFVVQRRGGAVASLDLLPFSLRLSNAVVSYTAYLAKMLWPFRLAVLYPMPAAIPVWLIASSAVLVVAVSAATLREVGARPYLFVGWFWYVGTLAPVIGIIQVGTQSMADRYTYVPLIGVFIAIAWGLSELVDRPVLKSLVTLSGYGVVALCAVLAMNQVRYWRSSTDLWRHTLDVTADNYRAHVAFGSLLQEEGRTTEAVAHYSRALTIEPLFAEAHNKLGAALADEGQLGDAVPHFVEAIRLKPELAEAHNNLGNALARQGKLDAALSEYEAALHLEPGNAQAHNGLGSALDDQGKVDDAIAQYEEAVRLKPDLAEAYNNLAASLVKKGQYDGAIKQLLEAVRLKPSEADFHYNAAVLLQHQRRISEARKEFEAALRIDPRYQPARRALEALGNGGP